MLRQYLFNVEILLDAPYIGKDETGQQEILEGYFQNVYVSAPSIPQAKTLIETVLSEGQINWANSTDTEIDLETLDKDISSHCKDPRLEGVWYLGPKFLYEADKGQA